MPKMESDAKLQTEIIWFILAQFQYIWIDFSTVFNNLLCFLEFWQCLDLIELDLVASLMVWDFSTDEFL